jgi:hypothetical protein
MLYNPKESGFLAEYVRNNPTIEIRQIADFPNPAIDGVIYLEADKNYRIFGTIDLLGARLECRGICAIFGESSETSYLASSGLTAGVALITTAYSLPMQNLSIQDVGAGRVFDIDGLGTAAIDWIALNILSCEVGTVKNVTNFIVSKSAWLTSYGLIFDGTVGTLSFDLMLMTSITAETLITFAATAVISRRFRVLFSSIVIPLGGVGIDFIAGFSVPTDMVILTDVGFSGGSLTYVTGLTANDNRSRWNECRGIDNSSNAGYYSMDNNAVPTIIGVPNTFYKIAGTTTAGALQRFTHSNNRLTYTGVLVRSFGVWVAASAEAGANNTIQVQIRRYDAANVLQEVSASTRSTTSGINRAENIATMLPVTMHPNDYIEVWIANSTSTNTTARELIVMVR